MCLFVRLVVCFWLIVLTAFEAHADKRVALVIGNGAYRSAPTLANPTNDAADVAASLKRSGFDVAVETNQHQIVTPCTFDPTDLLP